MSSTVNKTSTHKHIHIKLDVNMLEPNSLTDEVLFESAISVLEGHLANPAVDKGKLFRDMLEIPNLFELFTSAISIEGYAQLSSHITELFPREAAGFEETLASHILSELSRYCGALQDASLGLENCLRAIELARPVLSALAVLCSAEDVPEDSPNDASSKSKRVTQKMTKKAKRSKQALTVDPKPFVRIDVPVPTSKDEAISLTHSILNDQKGILLHYLDVFRQPGMSAYARAAYMPVKDVPPVTPVLPQVEDAPIKETFAVIEDEPETVYSAPLDGSLTAALHFDSPNGFGDWRLIIPQRASKDLRDARKKNPKLFEIILKKMRELSHGFFSSDNQKRLVGMDNDIPIFEAKMTGDTRLVYRIDCEQEYGSDVVTQVLRVYGVYTHAQMKGPRFWDAVSRVSGRGGVEYRRRCIYRTTPRRPGDYAIPPAMWPPQQKEEESANVPLPDIGLSAEEQQELHKTVVSEQFVAFSQAYLDGIIADRDVTHPFYTSPQEQAIIHHPGTAYVLGRSGTGKTTTMVFKIISRERRWKLQQLEHPAIEGARPRQLFITQSRVLANKVEEYYIKMSRALEVEYHDSQNRRLGAGSSTDVGMFDLDEEERHNSSLPERWSDLSDDHFPLFITSDQLCRLIESDFTHRLKETQMFREANGLPRDTLDLGLQQNSGRFVSFAEFQVSYWKRLPQYLRGLDPSSVYAEFIGVIKGSERALSSSSGVMDGEAYSSMSHRESTFDQQQRDAIYRSFEAYVKLKKNTMSYDAADRTHMIIRNLRQYGVPGKRREDMGDLCYHPGRKVDYIYVDETQDNLLVDTLIFRSMCRRPDGLFWAGDTAQTISAGSTFKFNELKSFMYRLEKGNKDANPQTFHLTKNYRSHGGIVKCAQTLIHLITRFWPQTIDNLPEERGLIEGMKPTFFSGGRHETPQFGQFLSGDTGTTIEFGARQCIIVRDEAARQRLLQDIGPVGLIFTVYESKGLEFEDVVIYDFFADSTATLSQWRIVLHELPASSASGSFPEFNKLKHHIICRESKSLYVALTRARANVWIIDYSEKGQAMKVLWQARDQVSVWTPGMPVPRLTTFSSREEWAAVGEELFGNKKFMQAVHAFERAGLPRQRDVAHAYHLRELARQVAASSDSSVSQQIDAFRAAAEAFLTLAQAGNKAEEVKVYYRISGECYASADDHPLAAKCYEWAQEFTLSAKTYRVAGSFDDALRLTKSHKQEIEPSVVENIIDISKLYYLKSGSLSKAKELFQSDDAALLDFTEEYGFTSVHATLLESSGRYTEAAKIRLQEGNIEEAVRLFLLPNDTETLRQACDCILAEFWKTMSLGIRLSHDNSVIRRLFSMVHRIPKDRLQPEQLNMLLMFETIPSSDAATLRKLGRSFSNEDSAFAAAFLCYDHVFSSFDFATVPVTDLIGVLQEFLTYARHLCQLALLYDPCHSHHLQKLLAFEHLDGDQYVVYRDSLLARHMGLDSTADGDTRLHVEVPAQSLNTAIHALLKFRLLDRVQQENEACRSSQAMRKLCSRFVVFKKCWDDNCGRLHVGRASLPAFFSERAALVLTQVNVYETIRRFERWGLRRDQERFWLVALYEAWSSPLTGFMAVGQYHGSLADLSALKKWLSDLLFDHAPDPGYNQVPPGYLTALWRYFTLSELLTGGKLPPFTPRLPCHAGPQPSWVATKEVHVVRNLLSFKAREPQGLQRSVDLLLHVFKMRIPLDAGILCDFLDDMSTFLIITYRARTTGGFHNIVLPRGWLAKSTDLFFDGPIRVGGRSLVQFHDYLAVISAALQCLYYGDGGVTGSDHLFPMSEPIPHSGSLVRNVPIARICQNLALVGFNVQNSGMKSQVHTTLKSFYGKETNPDLHYLYRTIATASLWSQVEDMVQRNAFELNVDDMIQLVHKSKASTMPAPGSGIKRVLFVSSREIPGQLVPSYVSQPQPMPRPPAPTVLAEAITEPSSAPSAHMWLTSTAHLDGLNHDEGDQLDENHDGSSGTANEPANVTFSEEQYARVQWLSQLWIRKIQRREREAANPMTSIAINRSRHFNTLLEAANETSMGNNRYYRKLCLGCVPHVLTCLDIFLMYARDGKRAATKRLLDGKVHHMELEAIQSNITEFNLMFQKATRLVSAIKPSAEVHRRADHGTLRRLIHETQDLVKVLPDEIRCEYLEEMRLALLGVRPLESV